MSWHFLQEQEAVSWEGECLDGAPDALLRLMPMPEACCSQGRRTEVSKGSRYGMTFEPSTVNPGDRQLMLFPVGFHAKTLARRVKVEDLPASVRGYGLRCSELLTRLGLVLSSRKTARTSESVGSAPSSRDLPRWGMTSGGACWELGTSARHIDGTECGYLPTPTANQTWKSNKGGAAGKMDGKWVGRKRLALSGMAQYGKFPDLAAHNQTPGHGWWAVEPGMGRVAHGMADRLDRLKAIGNGQVPRVAAEAFTILSDGWV